MEYDNINSIKNNMIIKINNDKHNNKHNDKHYDKHNDKEYDLENNKKILFSEIIEINQINDYIGIK
jgi:hypothetical protein